MRAHASSIHCDMKDLLGLDDTEFSALQTTLRLLASRAGQGLPAGAASRRLRMVPRPSDHRGWPDLVTVGTRRSPGHTARRGLVRTLSSTCPKTACNGRSTSSRTATRTVDNRWGDRSGN
ncbi:hypothetical protein GCM10027596_40780 [Nocardioides korecus]